MTPITAGQAPIHRGRMFLELRMRAVQGAFHMNPDYVTWYGLAEMKKDLVEIKADAAAIIREKH